MKDMRFPAPEELQKELKKFFKEKYGAEFTINASPQPARKDEKEAKEEKPIDINFDLKPKDIKAFLDRYVIGQEEAKKILSIAVCDHYNHVSRCSKSGGCDDYTKQNIIMIGPTGVGKTYLIKNIAKLIGVPFVKADATKFSETGYVGGDVEDLVRDLVRRADGNIKLAEYGIIYLDEIDKIATPRNIMGRDVSGRGVQMNLLKLMEETEVPQRTPFDIASQLQAFMEFQTKGKVEKNTINTKHILFVVSGAFNGLYEIVERRIRNKRIGFGASFPQEDEKTNLLSKVRSSDFVQFGFEPEFIGRLPVHAVCHDLDVDHLYKILKDSEGSIIKQYIDDFKAYDIEVVFSEEGMRSIAEKAKHEQTGARGLLTVCEKVFRDFKYELPDSSVRHFVVTKEMVDNPAYELKKLFEDSAYIEKQFIHEHLKQYESAFFDRTGIRITFDTQASDMICERARKTGLSINELCDQILKNYEYGLNLIAGNNGNKEFILTREVVENPTQTLDRWVKDSYQQKRS
ncbi:MAG: ATP-dependent protease [Spirochaetes bacterium]|nr:MAG: ATP-dependent protease [Spirochaetota bacterium]